MGGSFKSQGTYTYLWLTPVDVWQKPTQCCKAIILQLKIHKHIKKYFLVEAEFNHIPDYQEFQGLLQSLKCFMSVLLLESR